MGLLYLYSTSGLILKMNENVRRWLKEREREREYEQSLNNFS
jgi:hypothetical protein